MLHDIFFNHLIVYISFLNNKGNSNNYKTRSAKHFLNMKQPNYENVMMHYNENYVTGRVNYIPENRYAFKSEVLSKRLQRNY